MFSDKRYIVYVYVYQEQVVYAHIGKVKFPKTIRHTSVVAYNFYSDPVIIGNPYLVNKHYCGFYEHTRNMLIWYQVEKFKNIKKLK